jgi:acyl carrier protein
MWSENTVSDASNKDRYDKIFRECLSVDQKRLNAELVYNSVPEWDSVGHMSMMAALEGEFDIMLDPDDIIDFSSYQKGFEILAKYDVKL